MDQKKRGQEKIRRGKRGLKEDEYQTGRKEKKEKNRKDKNE